MGGTAFLANTAHLKMCAEVCFSLWCVLQEYLKATSPNGMQMGRRSMSEELQCTADENGACLCLARLPCDWQVGLAQTLCVCVCVCPSDTAVCSRVDC